MKPIEASATIQRIADSGLEISNADYRALVGVAQWLNQQSQQNTDIFARMTPEAVSGVLENIATDIKDGQNTTELDIIHLRQIADWLEKKHVARIMEVNNEK